MNENIETLSDATSIRSAVQAYARQLRDTLGPYMGVITQSADPLSRSAYQEPTLQQYDPHEHRDWGLHTHVGHAGSETGPQIARARSVIPPLREETLLAEWRKEEFRKPLLIVAPAGSGKSCLIESVALQMANDLLDEDLWPQSDLWPIGVPFLISMSKMANVPLDEYLQKGEEATTGREATLSRSLLNELRRNGRLVPLIDGFDEVPNAQGALELSLKTWAGGFALTTRPGYGERRIVSDTTRQRTLQELTVKQANAYVRAYFAERQCVGNSSERIVKLFNHAWRTHFGRLLRRPLYLKAWCDFVSEENGKRVPASLGDLAHLMFHRTLEARHLFSDLPLGDKHAAIGNFIDWFGRLALHCDKSEFEADPETLLRRGLIGEDSQKLIRLGKSLLFEDVATRCGFLIYSGNHTYQIPKVPLVEYLIGKYLANDAFRNPTSPQILIEMFRNWIWRPDRHDILDYAFDALWNSREGRESPWAAALLNWAKEVTRCDSPDEKCRKPHVNDDWAHPFANSMLRWRLLQATPKDEMVDDDVTIFVQSVRRLIKSGCWGGMRRDQLITCQAAIALIVDKMIEQYYRAGRDEAARENWLDAIRTAAACIRQEEAPELVHRWMQRHNEVCEDDEVDVPWITALCEAAAQVPEESARDLVVQWMRLHDEDSGFTAAKRAWALVIESAARRIREDEAAQTVTAWIGCFDLAREHEFSRWAWLKAIGAGATRLSERSSAELVATFMAKYDEPTGHIFRESRWLDAIEAAAARAGKETVGDLINQWMKGFDQAAGNEDVQEAFQRAICGAVRRSREEDAPDLISHFMKRHDEVHESSPIAWEWRKVIEVTAGRVPENDAARLIREWMVRHDETRTTDLAWYMAIRGGSGHVSEEDAADLVAHWMDRNDAASGREGIETTWRWAIEAAAGRVPDDAACALILQWISRYDDPRGHEVLQSACRAAIYGAADRVREDGALPSSKAEVMEVCNALLSWKAKEPHLAFKVAANSRSLAIISLGHDAPSVSETKRAREVLFKAVLRKDQVLDEGLVVVPPLVRAALVEKELTALEEPTDHEGTATVAYDHVKPHASAIERIRLQVAVLNEIEDFRARCCDWARRLTSVTSGVNRDAAFGDLRTSDSDQSDGLREQAESGDLSLSALPTDARLVLPRGERQQEQFIKHLRIFYEIGAMQLEETKPTYQQIAASFKKRRSEGTYPKEYPSTRSTMQRWCADVLPTFFHRELLLDCVPKLFEKFGTNNSNCGLSATGMQIWRLTRDCLRSEHLPPFER
jgi:hypothetical protein